MSRRRGEYRIGRETRCATANEFIAIIARHGRRFFQTGERVARFELRWGARVWFIDDYKGTPIYTHRGKYQGWSRYFSHGGTMLRLCQQLQRYITGARDTLPLEHLGPWPDWICAGDPWDYGQEAMEAVRRECGALAARLSGAGTVESGGLHQTVGRA